MDLPLHGLGSVATQFPQIVVSGVGQAGAQLLQPGEKPIAATVQNAAAEGPIWRPEEGEVHAEGLVVAGRWVTSSRSRAGAGVQPR